MKNKPKTTKTTDTLTIITSEASPDLVEAPTINVNSEDDKIRATYLLSRLNRYYTALTEDREKITAPLNEALKEVRAKYKPLETQLKTSIDTIRASLSAYQTAQLLKNKEAEQKIVSRIGEGKGSLKFETAMEKIATVQSSTATNVETNAGSIKFRTDLVLEVLNLDLIPREFFDLNETRLKKALKSNVAVDGARLKEVQTVINSIN